MSKVPYICGPLTELALERQKLVKGFYSALADACFNTTGERAFVPHEHYDPEAHANFTPQDVDAAERDQVCNKTSVLIVVALEPSWGGGIEVEMANRSGVPVILLCERAKLEQRKISRLLRGNPAVVDIFSYDTTLAALNFIEEKLQSMEASSAAA